MSEEVKNKSEYLVEVRDLKQYFPIKTGFMKTTPLKAVDGVSFSIKPGETLGLVGESGCGKTTVGRSLLRLYTPTSGDVFFDGERVNEKSIGHMRRQMQMVFQDPYSSLNPRMTVEDIIGEPLDVHKLYTSRGERRDKILHLMELVGLMAIDTSKSCPVLMPPKTPPALFDLKPCGDRESPCVVPRWVMLAKPAPISTPLTALMPIMA